MARPLVLLQRLGGLARKLVCLASNQSIRWLSRMANNGQGGEGRNKPGEVAAAEKKEEKVEVIEDNEDDEEGLPDAATAIKLIKEFETVTNTDEIMAQYQLQVSLKVDLFHYLFNDPGAWLGPIPCSEQLFHRQM